ncbi:MAG: DUF222 domain-containing protein [Acidimicrobiia bacterium]|nr:DUF222 domain-containing protein [Acidimicrobiia bacterium]
MAAVLDDLTIDFFDPDGLSAAADALLDADPTEWSDAVLAAEIVRRRSAIDRLEAQFAQLTWAAHQRGIGAADGSPSTAAWLRRRTGMREGDARAAIEAGEAGDALPRTASAWRDGAISTGAARTIFGARVTGHAPKLRAIEPLLLDMAREGVTRELQRACGHFRACAQAEGTEPRDHDGVTVSQTYGGRTVLNADLSSTAAEIVTTALHALTDPPTDDDRRTAARRRADALVRMAELALAQLHGRDPDGPVRARAACTVVIDWPTLHNGELGRMDGEFTGALHRSDVERLLCDCSVARVVTGPKGMPIDVSPNRRTIPTGLRRALAVRDQGCRYPGCRKPTGWCDAHHVIHWRHGGQTILINLVLLCDHHHHVVHQRGWSATFDGTTLRVYNPDGVQVQ